MGIHQLSWHAGGGIPGVPMGVPRVGNPRGEVTVARRATHPRNIEIRAPWIAAELDEDGLQVFPRLRVVDEMRLQGSQDFRVALPRERVLRRSWIERRERGLDHLARKCAERLGRGPRREHEDLARVQLLAPTVVRRIVIE